MSFADSDTMQIVSATLVNMLFNVPMIIITIVGIVLAIRNREKHPKTSQAAMAAFGILLVMNLISSTLAVWLPLTIYRQTNSTETIGWYTSGLSCFTTLVNTIAWALILMAIFRWRGAETVETERGFADVGRGV